MGPAHPQAPSPLVELVRGEIDAFLAECCHIWDHAPWILLVEEAGGRFTDRTGGHAGDQGGGLYSNANLHSQLLAALHYPPNPLVHVRPATTVDLHALAEVHVRSWQEAYVGQVPQDHLDALSVEQRLRGWTETFDRMGAQAAILVLDDDGVVAGFVHVCPSRDADAPDGVGEITSIYLRPSYWGRGGGRALIAGARDALAERGFEDAILWVLETNERARRFYESDGWRLDGSEKREAIGGVQIKEVRYRRSLA